MTKKIDLETLKECARSLCFPLLLKCKKRAKHKFRNKFSATKDLIFTANEQVLKFLFHHHLF